MVKAEYNILLDIRQEAPRETAITLTSGDVGTNVFNIKVCDGTDEVDYSQVDHAWIVFIKPDQTRVQGVLTARTAPFTGYTYTVPTNAIAAAGQILAAVLLFAANNDRLSTSRFTFTAQADAITESTVVSSNQYDALTALIADIEAKIAAGDFTGPEGPQGKGFNPKGVYATLAALQAAHPAGSAGDQYIVTDGTTDGTLLYIWGVDTSAWVSAGRVCDKGDPGADGITPHIGENGNWFIGTTDTGVKAQGPTGAAGTNGTNGTNGADGATPTINATTKRWQINGTDTEYAADTVIVSDTSSTTKTQLVADNTEYRFSSLTSLTLTFPSPGATGYFDASVAFTSGATATTFSGTGPKYKGDNVTNGVFTPIANRRYTITFGFDGTNIIALVSGVV